MSLFSEPAGGRFLREVIAAVDRLEDFPELGRMVPEYNLPRLREWFVGRYRVIYRLSSDGVQVLTLWPTAVPLEDNDSGRPT
jgi:plasmid stabilization system protein ParE